MVALLARLSATGILDVGEGGGALQSTLGNGQRTRQSDQSIKKRRNERCFWTPLCEQSGVWGRNVDGSATEGASATICTAPVGVEAILVLPRQRSTIQPSGSYRAIEHSPGTSTSPTSATKSSLKQRSPPFPHYFTCQPLTKQPAEAKRSPGGRRGSPLASLRPH